MSVPRGKQSSSPPVHLTNVGQLQSRNIQVNYQRRLTSPSNSYQDYNPASIPQHPGYATYAQFQSYVPLPPQAAPLPPDPSNKGPLMHQQILSTSLPTQQTMYLPTQPPNMQAFYGSQPQNNRTLRPSMQHIGMQPAQQIYPAMFPTQPNPAAAAVMYGAPNPQLVQAQAQTFTPYQHPGGRGMAANVPQYPVSTGQPTPPYMAYYNNAQNQMFMGGPTLAMQQSQQRQGLPVQGAYQKREKKTLMITDPITGKNILEDMAPPASTSAAVSINTSPQSGRSSAPLAQVAQGVSPPQPSTTPNLLPGEIAAQFAALVAATLTPTPTPTRPPQHHPQQQQQQHPQQAYGQPPPIQQQQSQQQQQVNATRPAQQQQQEQAYSQPQAIQQQQPQRLQQQPQPHQQIQAPQHASPPQVASQPPVMTGVGVTGVAPVPLPQHMTGPPPQVGQQIQTSQPLQQVSTQVPPPPHLPPGGVVIMSAPSHPPVQMVTTRPLQPLTHAPMVGPAAVHHAPAPIPPGHPIPQQAPLPHPATASQQQQQHSEQPRPDVDVSAHVLSLQQQEAVAAESDQIEMHKPMIGVAAQPLDAIVVDADPLSRGDSNSNSAIVDEDDQTDQSTVSDQNTPYPAQQLDTEQFPSFVKDSSQDSVSSGGSGSGAVAAEVDVAESTASNIVVNEYSICNVDSDKSVSVSVSISESGAVTVDEPQSYTSDAVNNNTREVIQPVTSETDKNIIIKELSVEREEIRTASDSFVNKADAVPAADKSRKDESAADSVDSAISVGSSANDSLNSAISVPDSKPSRTSVVKSEENIAKYHQTSPVRETSPVVRKEDTPPPPPVIQPPQETVPVKPAPPAVVDIPPTSSPVVKPVVKASSEEKETPSRVVSAVPAKSEPQHANEDRGKTSSKSKKKVKARELNALGKGKEGTDMDAIVDRQARQVVPDVQPSKAKQQQQQKASKQEVVAPKSDVQKSESRRAEVRRESPEISTESVKSSIPEAESPPELEADSNEVAIENKRVNDENEKTDGKKDDIEAVSTTTEVVETTPAPTTAENVEETVVVVEPVADPEEVVEPVAELEEGELPEDEEEEPSPPKMELKYQYKEDQWSPLNPEGKRQYDRDFLLKLQFAGESCAKPEGLPPLPEVVLDQPHPRDGFGQADHQRSHMPQSSGGGGGGGGGGANIFDFSPGFIKGQVGRGGSGSMTKNRSQQGRKPEIKRVITIPQPDIKLHQAEKAWKAGSSYKPSNNMDDEAVESSATEVLYKGVRSILNKLTPQNFTTLAQQMKDMQINTPARLSGVINLTFEKAISEPAFSVAYANICKFLSHLQVSVDGNSKEYVQFRKVLLTRCQAEFERDKADGLDLENRMKEINQAKSEEEKKVLRAVFNDLETKSRRRTLGNIRFIGELYKLKMLTATIMHNCIIQLMRSHDDESIECLCRLLMTVGKNLDTSEYTQQVNQYFDQMRKIISSRKTSSRVRFMLQDTVDLRTNGWVPRRDENAPKTIEEIHQDAKKEQQQNTIYLQQISQQQKTRKSVDRGGRGGGRPQGGGQGGGQGSGTGEEGWSMVAPRTYRTPQFDINKLKLRSDESTIQLGSGQRFASWARGSSIAGPTRSQEQERHERPSTPGNRFMALTKSEEQSADLRSRGVGRGVSPARGDLRGDLRGHGSQGRDTPRRPINRGSQEAEKDRAIRAAREISGRSTPPSRGESRENSRSRDHRASPVNRELSDADIDKKTKDIINEYLHAFDNQNVILSVEELKSPGKLHKFVFSALAHILERSPKAREQVGILMHMLVQQKIITVDAYVKGLSELLEFGEDFEADVPKIWTYLGDLISLIVHDNTVKLNFLRNAVKVMPEHIRGKLVAEVLHSMEQRVGHIQVAEMWSDSGLNWAHFLAPGANISAFLVDKKLEFTMETAPRSPTSSVISLDKLETTLDRLLQEEKNNDDIFDWIEMNVDPETRKSRKFIRALSTCVYRSSIKKTESSFEVNEKEMLNRLQLMLKYLQNQQEDLELQALYALQALITKMEHPSGLLRTFFEKLFDSEIISEEAFKQWHTSNDPAEQAGKGVALKQVVQFYKSIETNEGDGLGS